MTDTAADRRRRRPAQGAANQAGATSIGTPTPRRADSCRSTASTTSSSGSATPPGRGDDSGHVWASHRSPSAGSRQRSATGQVTCWFENGIRFVFTAPLTRTGRSPSMSASTATGSTTSRRGRGCRVGLARDDMTRATSALSHRAEGGRGRVSSGPPSGPTARRLHRSSTGVTTTASFRPADREGLSPARAAGGAQPARGRSIAWGTSNSA